MDEILKNQLELYEQGDLSALEQILSSTLSQLPQDDGEITIVSEAVTMTTSGPVDENQEVHMVEHEPKTKEATQYPPLTTEVTHDISKIAKEWIRLHEALSRINNMRKEFDKEKKEKNERLLEYIEKYGLRDITKGKHQLVPKVKKGGKKGYQKKSMQEHMIDYLSTVDILKDVGVDEIAEQAVDYLDNMRGTRDDTIQLEHQSL